VFERIVDFALRNRAAVFFFTFVVVAAGIASFRGLTIEAFPDPTDTQVNVLTVLPGQPTEEIERQIGLPIERALNGTPGLSRLRNLSLFGLSYVTLTFDDGVDPLFARAQVLERLRDADLPDGVTPELGPLATPIGEIYRYSLTSATADPMTLRTAQEWTVRPRLMRVQGVADVVSYGGLVREIQVQPSPSALAAYGLTIEDVETALKKASQNASGGVLARGAEQLVIRSEGLFRSLDDIRSVHVATHEGTPVLVRDVATVSDGWAPRQGVVSRGTDYDTIEGIVLMRRGENPSVVLEHVRDAITELNERTLPGDIRVTPFYDRTDLVDTTLHTVGRNLLEGAALVIFVLFVFLLDIRAALIVAALIPLSLLSAFVYLKARGLSANLLSMGAVDFGIIVDGGVVIIESIVRRLAAATVDGTPPESVQGTDLEAHVRQAVAEVVRPTVFSLLIIIAAYLPIFLLQRVEGRIFAPMANTVVAALVGALVFSLTLVPVLATIAYRRPVPHRESPVIRAAKRAYEPLLAWSTKHTWVVIGGSLLALLAALGAVPRLGSEFLPALNEGSLWVTFTLPPDISIDGGRLLVPRITEVLAREPEVAAIMSQLGRPEDGTDPTLPNNVELFVRLTPPTSGRRA
jgi:cobalt-zinc-cadmium resistance protein CzcA